MPKGIPVDYEWRKPLVAQGNSTPAFERIRELHESGVDLRTGSVKKGPGEAGSLLKALERKKIGWPQALRKAGLKPEDIFGHGGYPWMWDVDVIAKRVKQLSDAGEMVNQRAMREKPGENASEKKRLLAKEKRAIFEHLYKGLKIPYSKILEKAGLADKQLNNWTKWPWKNNRTAIVEKLVGYMNGKQSVSPSSMLSGGREKSALYRHAVERLNTPWSELHEQAAQEYFKRNGTGYYWMLNKPLIAERLRFFHSQGRDLSKNAMLEHPETKALVTHLERDLQIPYLDMLRQLKMKIRE